MAKPKAPAAKPVKMYGAREDLGKPVDGFFAKAPAATKPILLALRDLVEKIVPDATASLKWGMPVYSIGGNMTVAIGGHKAHVNLILAGPPDAFADPDGLLEGAGKTGRHLKVTDVKAIPKAQVKAWVKTAAELARSK